LALISIRAKLNSVISLSGARSGLVEGEKLFSIGCPGNPSITVNSAFIIGPPRSMNNLPLWQVSMQTLPGSSGSPVFDTAGNLVAIVKGRYRGTDSVGFLTPLDTMREFLQQR
jgi:serine protease Do